MNPYIETEALRMIIALLVLVAFVIAKSYLDNKESK